MSSCCAAGEEGYNLYSSPGGYFISQGPLQFSAISLTGCNGKGSQRPPLPCHRFLSFTDCLIKPFSFLILLTYVNNLFFFQLKILLVKVVRIGFPRL